MMDKERVQEVLGQVDLDLVEELEAPRKRKLSRGAKAALIAACLCVAVLGTAFTYILSARAAMRQVYAMGMFYQQNGVRHELSDDFLDLLENQYTTEVDQTAEGENMDVTLANVVAFESGDSHVIGYLLRFTLPEGVSIEENQSYYFLGTYQSQVDFKYVDDQGSFGGHYEDTIYIPTGAENTWYAFVTQKFVADDTGDTAVLELSNFSTDILDENDQEHRKTLVMGDWRFEVQLDYQESTALVDTSADIVDDQTKLYGLSISPIGVEVRILRNGTFATYVEREPGHSIGGWSLDMEKLDAWYSAASTLYLVMEDGDRIELSSISGEVIPDHEAGLTECVYFSCFDTPIDLTHVYAVELAGVQFPLPETE